jgi:ATP-dependent DNA helicase DinG
VSHLSSVTLVEREDSREVVNVSEFFKQGGPLATIYGTTYSRRPQQVELAEAVAAVLKRPGLLLADAPTGTGKTHGYLVPLALAGKPSVIATNTIALQQQLVEKDLPLLKAACIKAGIRPPSYALYKGRSNFLCERRFEEYLDEQESSPFPSTGDLDVIKQWGRQTLSGDKEELETHIPKFWQAIEADADDCQPTSCPYRDKCFYYGQKDRALASDIIVVNHALLAINMRLGGGLFPMNNRALYIDEAHAFGDVLSEHFGTRVTRVRLRRIVMDIRRKAPDLEGYTDDVEQAAESFFRNLTESTPLGDPDNVPLSFDDLVGSLAELHTVLRDCQNSLVRALEGKVRRVLDDLVSFFEPPQSTHAYSVIRTEWGRQPLALQSWLIEPGEVFRETVIKRGAAPLPTILCSATLKVAGSFRHIRNTLGLEDQATVPIREFEGREVFDYANNSLVYVARDLPEPQGSTTQRAIDEGLERTAKLVSLSDGRALVLLATKAAVDRYREKFRPPYPVRFQDDASPTQLVAWLKSTPRAVLVGTRSFWQGVDIPGEALSLLVIDKIPFPYQADPVISALCERAGPRAFQDVSLPRALMPLQQGVGRLIRTVDDRGVIAILDSRILRKGWGKSALRSLPQGAPGTDALGDVGQFFGRARGAA